MGIVRETRVRETFAVGSHYQATASEDVTVNTSACVCVCVCVCKCNSVVMSCIEESYKSDYQSKPRL
jgi:hypothetical protein